MSWRGTTNVPAFHVGARAIHEEFTEGLQIHGHRNTAVTRRHIQEEPMSNEGSQVRITLTPEQRAMVKNATGKDAESLELSVQELEERIAPGKVGGLGGGKQGF
jgi:hypothetical protein